MIKLFLTLNKGTNLFLQKVSEFSGSFFDNLDSWAFLPTWDHLFLERFLQDMPRETEVWEDNTAINK